MSQETSSAAEIADSTQEGIQPGLAARAEALNSIANARESLGRIATGPIVTAGGEVLTDLDRAEELRVRQEQGHAYQR